MSGQTEIAEKERIAVLLEEPETSKGGRFHATRLEANIKADQLERVAPSETIEDEINRLHQANCEVAQQVIQRAIRIGELLLNKKASLPHGEWLPWFSKNIKFSTQTADNYRKVYTRQAELKFLTIRNLNDAYRLMRNADKLLKDKVQPTPKSKVEPADFADQTSSVPKGSTESILSDLPAEPEEEAEPPSWSDSDEVEHNDAPDPTQPPPLQPDPAAGIVDKERIKRANRVADEDDLQPWTDLISESFAAWLKQWGKAGSERCAAFVMVEAIAWAKKQDITNVKVILEGILEDWKD